MSEKEIGRMTTAVGKASAMAAVLTMIMTAVLVGCDRPQISQSELGRISPSLPDNPELREKYHPRELPEEANIYDMNIPQEKFVKLLGLPDDVAKKYATPGMGTPPAPTATTSETPVKPVAPTPAVKENAPEKTPTPEDIASTLETPSAEASDTITQGFEILTDEEEPAESTPASEPAPIPAETSPAEEKPTSHTPEASVNPKTPASETPAPEASAPETPAPTLE